MESLSFSPLKPIATRASQFPGCRVVLPGQHHPRHPILAYMRVNRRVESSTCPNPEPRGDITLVSSSGEGGSTYAPALHDKIRPEKAAFRGDAAPASGRDSARRRRRR